MEECAQRAGIRTPKERAEFGGNPTWLKQGVKQIMRFYSFDETTYPGIPDDVGPEVRQTNKFCDPVLAAQTCQEHLDEWTLCEDAEFASLTAMAE